MKWNLITYPQYFLNFNLTDYYLFSTLKEYLSRKSLGNNENITSSQHSKYTKNMSRSSHKIRTKFLSEKHLHIFNTYQKGFVEYSTFGLQLDQFLFYLQNIISIHIAQPWFEYNIKKLNTMHTILHALSHLFILSLHGQFLLVNTYIRELYVTIYRLVTNICDLLIKVGI